MFEKAISFSKNTRRKIDNLSKNQKIVAIIIIVVIFAVTVLGPKTPIDEVAVISEPDVTIINVGAESSQSEPLEVTGTVRSQSEAGLRTETQGEVVFVYRKVGDFVSAGTVIAEIRNNRERAAVLQAEASLEAARANLQKGTGGVRSETAAILEANVASAKQSLISVKSSIVVSLKTAYANVNSATANGVDLLFSNASSNNPVINVASSESAVANRLQQERVALQTILNRQQGMTNSLSSGDDLFAELSKVQEELVHVSKTIADALIVINKAIPNSNFTESQISTAKANLLAQQATINGTLSILAGNENALSGANTALLIAEQNKTEGSTGAQAEDVTSLQAAVKQAEAQVSVARANLNQTLIISPISGTINTLQLRKGDFVNAFSTAATVSNNNALEIETFITDSDKTNISVGSKATIDSRYEGVVTSVAPGLDQATKKISVKIGVIGTSASLTNGSSVRVLIDRNANSTISNEEDLAMITIPISALKIETNRTIVFEVKEDNTLIAVPVELGLVLGDSVVIRSGITASSNIVKDARGLREGQKVTIKN